MTSYLVGSFSLTRQDCGMASGPRTEMSGLSGFISFQCLYASVEFSKVEVWTTESILSSWVLMSAICWSVAAPLSHWGEFRASALVQK